MSESLDEFDMSSANTPVANTKANLPSLGNCFTNRKKLFTNDQEVVVDSHCALVVVNDANLGVPLPSFYPKQVTPARRASSKVLLRFETTSPKKDSEGSRSMTIRKRGLYSPNVSEVRRISQTLSYNHSDTGLKDHTSEPGSGPKTVSDDVDVFSDHKETEQKKKPERWFRRKVRVILDSMIFNIVVCIATIYTLFVEDIIDATLDSSTDKGFDIVNFIWIGLFSVDIALSFWINRSYRFSFFFWLDILSTLSILLDVDFLVDDIFYPDDPNSNQKGRDTSEVALIGEKTGRVFRIVRLIRLVRFYKQITQNRQTEDPDLQLIRQNLQRIHPGGLILERRETRKKRETQTQITPGRKSATVHPISLSGIPDKSSKGPKSGTLEDSNGSRVFNDNERISYSMLGMLSPQNAGRRKSSGLSRFSDSSSHQVKESRVGKKLSELTTKRVIVLVLLLLIVNQFFDYNFYYSAPASQKYQMQLIADLINKNVVSNVAETAAINSFISQQKEEYPKLVYFEIAGQIMYQDTTVDISNLRPYEAITITIETATGSIISVTDSRLQNVVDSWLSVGRTVFIIVLLTFAAVMFNNDAKNIILVPLERIIEKVNKLAKDPLLVKEERQVIEGPKGFENEAIEVENAITKIANLLALGFGDAGSAIITQNIGSHGDVTTMGHGRKRAAIYGFCDIRNFTDATEVLQEDVMIFVNSIAEVVHSVVDKFAGAANKNIGDAFLLVWKFPEDCVLELSGGRLEITTGQNTQNLADCALMSFLKIYARINRDPILLKYREDPGLISRLPNYKVKMGFGLHVGWAIEGAIGSDFKIDASYLSPNVNMASRLEAATKQYGVPLLFSGELYDMLSETMQETARLIDVVTVKGSNKPIELYTVDMDVEGISPAKDRSARTKDEKKLKHKEKKEFVKTIMENSYAYTLLESDKELKYMLRNRNEEFTDLFNSGFDAYIDGDWATAKRRFEACLEIRAADGPTQNLYRLLEEHEFIAPDEWEGYHVLTEK